MKKFFKEGLSRGLLITSRLLPSQGIPILTYHSIDSSGSTISTSQEVFKSHIEYLADQGFRTISLRAYYDRLTGLLPDSEREIVLTFDDGFKNNYDVVFPLMKRFGFTATFFLTAGFIGKTCRWPMDTSIPEMPLLSWDEVREMSSEGMEFGAHTVSHVDLTGVSEETAMEEIVRSKSIIEEQLCKPVEFFCYPYGKYLQQHVDMVKESGFLGGCSIKYGVRNQADDRYCLRRVGTARFSNLFDFKAGVHGSYGLYVSVRDLLRWV